MLHDTARTANGMLPPENWTYEHEVPRYHFNPAEARHLLQAVGYSPHDPRLGVVYKTIPEGARWQKQFGRCFSASALLSLAQYSDAAFASVRLLLSFPRACLACARNPETSAWAGKKTGTAEAFCQRVVYNIAPASYARASHAKVLMEG
ncbi:MAG: hypothetical protein JO071_04270 [Deltaproteobacteria bacterium]|nr:hypothetical protein [Deltaproteobacteria bacterium]